MQPDRVSRIRERLQAALSPSQLDIEDDSASHAGHEGAKGGGGHFNVTVVAEAFSCSNRCQRANTVRMCSGTFSRSSDAGSNSNTW